MIETVAVVTVVSLAALFLLRRAWRLVRPRAAGECGCGPKPGCPAAESMAEELKDVAKRAARRA